MINSAERGTATNDPFAEISFAGHILPMDADFCRLAQPIAMAVSSLVIASEVNAQTELRASVDLSEWTPSRNLVLNLLTGNYVIKPPTEGWPASIAQPVEQRGQLADENLRMMRALAEAAFKTGLTDRECEAKKGREEDINSNAVGPEMLILSDGRIIQTSAQTRCRSRAANALIYYITRLFDNRSP